MPEFHDIGSVYEKKHSVIQDYTTGPPPASTGQQRPSIGPMLHPIFQEMAAAVVVIIMTLLSLIEGHDDTK